jgi:hypothetical protein
MNRWLLIGFCGLGAFSCGASVTGDEPTARVQQSVTLQQQRAGLSLLFANGAAPPKLIIGNGQRFVQEIDLVESVSSAADQGIQPLLDSSRTAALNWNGVQQAEEIWVPAFDGTFTRERYYRGARWMEQASTFRLRALDQNGNPIGTPWVVRAGRDNRLGPQNDVFVRRFVARQSAFGCASVGDCSSATGFTAQALVQLRDALDPAAEAHTVPAATRELRLVWNRLPDQEYVVQVDREAAQQADFDYGFQVAIEPASTPANGTFYEPGEAASFRMVFRDGQGNRLHPPGGLPTYADYLNGDVESGLRYLDQSIQTRLYYALKHRESNLLFVLSGPTDRLKTPQTVVDPSLFFLPQVPFATPAVDGFTAVAQTVPPVAVVFGGATDPTIWQAPVSDVVTFTIPADADPGTYVAAVKARRDYAGEALNRGATLVFQVGQAQTTQFVSQTQCNSCHNQQDRTDFASILHGIDDRRGCFGCHSSLGIEFDNALDIRVHAIHDRSDRFDADINDCSLCHTTPPTGPQRGVLP